MSAGKKEHLSYDPEVSPVPRGLPQWKRPTQTAELNFIRFAKDQFYQQANRGLV